MQLDHNYSPILGYIFFYLVRKNAGIWDSGSERASSGFDKSKNQGQVGALYTSGFSALRAQNLMPQSSHGHGVWSSEGGRENPAIQNTRLFLPH